MYILAIQSTTCQCLDEATYLEPRAEAVRAHADLVGDADTPSSARPARASAPDTCLPPRLGTRDAAREPRTLIAVGAGHELELRLFHQEPAHVSYYTWYNNESLNKSAGM